MNDFARVQEFSGILLSENIVPESRAAERGFNNPMSAVRAEFEF
jgi:hypothetical protein